MSDRGNDNGTIKILLAIIALSLIIIALKPVPQLN
jgi:hypothetical protein